MNYKEILWEEVSRKTLRKTKQSVGQYTRLISVGISFPDQNLHLNVSFDNPAFEELMREKFEVSVPYYQAPCLTFSKHSDNLGFKLPHENYGYVSSDRKNAVVFGSSFGVLKSVVSGFASLLKEDDGCFPVHGSFMIVDGKGIFFTGGTMAGKTTTLINLVGDFLRDGRKVFVLTDDWGIVGQTTTGYVAETFDPSISLKKQNLQDSPFLRFYQHGKIIRLIEEKSKVNFSPSALYNLPIATSKLGVDMAVLLLPEPGECHLMPIDKSVFAQSVVDAAYHYPYLDDIQIKRHIAFWHEFGSRLEVFQFHTRSMDGGFQCLDPIRRLLS